MEPVDLWDRYLEPSFRGRIAIGAGRTSRLVDGVPVSDNTKQPGGGGMARDTRYQEAFADAVAHDFDAASNLRDMDREGVDVAVLFPTLGLYMTWARFNKLLPGETRDNSTTPPSTPSDTPDENFEQD
jgi:hypothetical protein